MTDRPMIFSARMVCALLQEVTEPGTGKTVTRRLMSPQPETTRYCDRCGLSERVGCEMPDCEWGSRAPLLSSTQRPCAAGDRAWVKEAWCA